ncbi:MAG: hypothetical protein ACOC9S_06540 [Planctomycetota bacterium]
MTPARAEMTARACILPAVAVAAALCSCSAPPSSDGYRLDPLAFRQRQAYPEAAGGRFVSLADFEDAPGNPGHRQVGNFSVSGGGSRSFTVNVSSTGSGAMEVLLPPGAELRFDLPDIRNFTGYALLSLAVHSDELRDDLQVTLSSPSGEWTSSRRLVRPGWNSVPVDLRRAGRDGELTLTDVRSIRLGFPEAADSVRFVLDDVLLIDNRREISPVPDGLTVLKEGLDYRISMTGRDRDLRLRQSDDGLWRFDDQQPILALGERDAAGERLDVLGDRRVGHVELVEHNSIRVRIVSTWYFPGRAGAWASMSVRKIRWEHTFYSDGRWVCSVDLDAAGAEDFSGLTIRLPSVAAVAGDGRSGIIEEPGFSGPSGRWSYLIGGAGRHRRVHEANYLNPPKITPQRAREDTFAAGDFDEDLFDESQGCFTIFASGGRCRFTVRPGDEPRANPVFRVVGPWSRPPVVTVAGMRIGDVVLLEDGSALFVLPVALQSGVEVELSEAGKAQKISASNADL